MDTGDYIFWLVYPLGWLYTTWRIAGQVAWSFAYDHYSGKLKQPEGADVLFGLFMGSMAALIWPLALPAAFLIDRGASGRFIYTPQDKKLKMAEQRIRELEKEVGIR